MKTRTLTHAGLALLLLFAGKVCARSQTLPPYPTGYCNLKIQNNDKKTVRIQAIFVVKYNFTAPIMYLDCDKKPDISNDVWIDFGNNEYKTKSAPAIAQKFSGVLKDLDRSGDAQAKKAARESRPLGEEEKPYIRANVEFEGKFEGTAPGTLIIDGRVFPMQPGFGNPGGYYYQITVESIKTFKVTFRYIP